MSDRRERGGEKERERGRREKERERERKKERGRAKRWVTNSHMGPSIPLGPFWKKDRQV